MPIIVKDFTWEQTDKEVFISVPLKGTKASQSDVICTDEYLKVCFPPFLFEVILFAPIDEDRSSAKIGNGIILFTLHKTEPSVWDSIAVPSNTADLSTVEILEQLSDEDITNSNDVTLPDSNTWKTALKPKSKYHPSMSNSPEIQLEEDERKRIEHIKEEENRKATEELERWKAQQTIEKEQKRLQREEIRKAEEKRKNERSKSIFPNTVKPQITTEKKVIEKVLPPTRTSGSIKIQFTPRIFPTALRESRMAEEEEWLHKQAEARRAINADLLQFPDLTEEEKNPEWLKDKGNKLFAAGDYLAAVNAFNLAIQLNQKLPSLYLNRSACHLKLRNLHKAIEDSSKALELLTPPVPSNACARIKAHVRRGTAFCELELYVEGLQDYEAALKIDPNNQNVKADAAKIRQIIQGSSSTPE
ncbi:dynein axonemal assembly factor 4 [Bombina bombina]|uniref:dynein axonemal assembly factor 4 n=1 Tax=Bombina bombina TaxID=8345 RepID=UPI00235B188F|nr:dynein axonemal assembly factor 4 [Bombina bombina]